MSFAHYILDYTLRVVMTQLISCCSHIIYRFSCCLILWKCKNFIRVSFSYYNLASVVCVWKVIIRVREDLIEMLSVFFVLFIVNRDQKKFVREGRLERMRNQKTQSNTINYWKDYLMEEKSKYSLLQKSKKAYKYENLIKNNNMIIEW